MALFDFSAALILPKHTPTMFPHSEDLCLIELLYPTTTGPWIAGGACLAWYQNLPCTTDIDVYFNSHRQFTMVYDYIVHNQKMFNVTDQHKTANAITLTLNSPTLERSLPKVQLINKQFFNSTQEIIDTFDITVCQIAWDGSGLTVGNHFVQDVAERNLRFSKFSPASHKRLLKYICYGYEPVEGCIEDLVDSEDIDWETKGSDHYA